VPFNEVLCSISKDGGSLRLYRPPDTKVLKAIRGLNSEISSVIAVTPNTGGFGHIWVACGSSVSVDTLQVPATTSMSSTEH